MAYLIPYLRFTEKYLRQGIKILELGDQFILDGPSKSLARDYFLRRGIDYTSVDIHGLNGAVRKNLNKPKQFEEWRERFDVVTNIGTSEHVAKQYECFQIIHNVTKPGGLMVHLVPHADEERWKGHSPYAYTHFFFREFAVVNNYTILGHTMLDCMIAIVLRRQRGEFKTNGEFFEDYVVKREHKPSLSARIDWFVKRWGISKVKRMILG